MPIRTLPLVNGEYYHVFNRGVALQPTFNEKRDFERFILCLSYYKYKAPPFKLSRLLQLKNDERMATLSKLEITNNKVVDILAYCLMPNHFHLLLKQITDDGISTFLRLITNSYTKYVNVKAERVGPLFQGAFKAVHIESDEQLLHVSRYIHLNPLVSYVVKDAHFLAYPWSSLREYSNGNSELVDLNEVLEHFKNTADYVQFVLDQAEYGKELEKIKHLRLD